jgi:hypothetical protein
MISGTYLTCGILLISAQLFTAGVLSATTQALCWTVIPVRRLAASRPAGSRHVARGSVGGAAAATGELGRQGPYRG